MDWRILLLQIRSLLAITYFLVCVLVGSTIVYLWDDLSGTDISECVALSPPSSTAWKSCTSDTYAAYIGFFYCGLALFPLFVGSASFVSSQVVRTWWKKLIFEGKIERAAMSTVSRTTQSVEMATKSEKL